MMKETMIYMEVRINKFSLFFHKYKKKPHLYEKVQRNTLLHLAIASKSHWSIPPSYLSKRKSLSQIEWENILFYK